MTSLLKKPLSVLFLAAILVPILIATNGCSGDSSSSTGNFTLVGSGTVSPSPKLEVIDSFAVSGLDPLSLKVKIYEFWVSANGDCSSPERLLSNTAPTGSDMLLGPTFTNTSLADGTYNCIIIVMSDIISPTPGATSDNNYCQQGVEYDQDVCSSGGGGNFTGVPGGAHAGGACADAEQVVSVYFSTWSTSTTGSNGFAPPVSDGDAANGFKLTAAMTVAGTTIATITIDGTGKVEEQGTSCDMQPPSFGFSSQ